MNNIVTPAGRKCYLDILLKYLIKYKEEFDEWEIWVNTKNNEDVEYINFLGKTYSWIKLIHLDTPLSDTHCMYDIYKFWKYLNKENIYLRLDDDIVFIEKNSIKNIFAHREKNKNPFLIYGNIVNNQRIDFIRQKYINYSDNIEDLDNGTLWRSPRICKNLHELFLQDNNKFKLTEDYTYTSYPRISINAICFFGKDVCDENFIQDEEAFVSHILPERHQRPNEILSNTLFVHYAFGPQRDGRFFKNEIALQDTDILERYKLLSEI